MHQKKTETSQAAPVTEFEQLTDEFKKQTQKLTDLQLRLSEIDNEINGISAKLSEVAEGAGVENVSHLTAAAQQMLTGEVSVFKIVEELRDKTTNLRQQRPILIEAIRLQGIAVEEARVKRSVAGAATARPEYREKVLRMARAVAELSSAIRDERLFRDELSQRGISFCHVSAGGTVFTRVGELTDHNSRATYYLAELLQRGWITQAEMAEMVKG